MRIKKITYGSLLGMGSVGMLIGMALLLLCSPTFEQSAQAADTISADLLTKTTTNLASMISVALTEKIEIDVTPKSTGALATGSADLKVATNNATGYAIYLSTADQSNQLNQVDTTSFQGDNTKYAIKALPTETTAKNYLSKSENVNTWGYALTKGAATSDTVYKGVKNAGGDNIYSVKGTTSNDSYKLNIAVAVNAMLPAGAYQNGLIVSAVANPIEVRGFRKIYYMQEMTPEVCASASEHETGQLVDKRDNNIYYVAKLKDGKCWMTQNLALDLDKNVTLTPEDTNITANWTPAESTNETDLNGTALAGGADKQYSWSWGKVLLATPRASVGCNAYSTDADKSATLSDNLAETCKKSGFVNVQNDWLPTFEAKAGTFGGKEYNYVALDEASGTYDPHYLIGNFYSYGAASAGTVADSKVQNKNVSGSICPKGWRLATSTVETIDSIHYPGDDGEYYQLMQAYGYAKKDTYKIDRNKWAYAPIIVTGEANLAVLPMGVTRAGFVRADLGYLSFAGYDGRLWSSTSGGASNARGFMLNGYGAYGAVSDGYATGVPVRCIAE